MRKTGDVLCGDNAWAPCLIRIESYVILVGLKIREAHVGMIRLPFSTNQFASDSRLGAVLSFLT